MLEPDFIDLMNREIDGENSTSDHVRLEQYLKTHPEADDYFRKLKAVTGMMERAEEKTPPPAVKENILNTIQNRMTSANRKPKTGYSTISRSRMFLRLGTAFAAGLLIGLSLFALLIPPEASDLSPYSQYPGTMMRTPPDRNRHAAAFSRPGLELTADTEWIGEILLVHVKLTAEQSCSLKLDWGKTGLDFQGQLIRSQTGPVEIKIDQSFLDFHVTGDHHVTFSYRTTRSTGVHLQLELSEGSHLLYQRSFSTSNPNSTGTSY